MAVPGMPGRASDTAAAPFPVSSGEDGGSPERNHEPITPAPIPPYQYPKERKDVPMPPARPTKGFIERAPEPVQQPIVISHQRPPTQEVVRQPEPSKTLTPEPSKILTPVHRKEPEKINEKLTKQPQSVNFSETRPLNFSGPKLPKKLKYHGRKGRQRTNEQVVELLTFVQMKGTWPHGVSDQMQRYYRREYPEYFRKGRKKGSTGKVPVVRSAPINIQARRTGSGS